MQEEEGEVVLQVIRLVLVEEVRVVIGHPYRDNHPEVVHLPNLR